MVAGPWMGWRWNYRVTVHVLSWSWNVFWVHGEETKKNPLLPFYSKEWHTCMLKIRRTALPNWQANSSLKAPSNRLITFVCEALQHLGVINRTLADGAPESQRSWRINYNDKQKHHIHAPSRETLIITYCPHRDLIHSDAGGRSKMQLDGLWTVHTLLALSGFALGNPILNEPLAAPRVFISFKGRNLDIVLPLLCFSLLISWLLIWHLCNRSKCAWLSAEGFVADVHVITQRKLHINHALLIHRPPPRTSGHHNIHQMLPFSYNAQLKPQAI